MSVCFDFLLLSFPRLLFWMQCCLDCKNASVNKCNWTFIKWSQAKWDQLLYYQHEQLFEREQLNNPVRENNSTKLVFTELRSGWKLHANYTLFQECTYYKYHLESKNTPANDENVIHLLSEYVCKSDILFFFWCWIMFFFKLIVHPIPVKKWHSSCHG